MQTAIVPDRDAFNRQTSEGALQYMRSRVLHSRECLSGEARELYLACLLRPLSNIHELVCRTFLPGFGSLAWVEVLFGVPRPRILSVASVSSLLVAGQWKAFSTYILWACVYRCAVHGPVKERVWRSQWR